MKTIVIKTQAEFDALPAKFDEYTVIEIRHGNAFRLIVHKARGNSSVVARGNSSVVAWGNSSVVARENSSVVAWGNSSVEAWENSSVVARENSSVEAWENSSVVAWGNSSVVAWENSSVVARENSSVVARENSSVEARGNSSVEARENSSVVARGNSSVVAWGNSSVVAWGNVGVHAQSIDCVITLFSFSVAWLIQKAKVTKKSKTATIIIPEIKSGTEGWLESQAIESAKTVILFKKVSKDFKTQEGGKKETLWAVGSTLEHATWEPKTEECGEGKFHACSRPYFCDEFRNEKGDRYIALQVAKADLFAWPNPYYPHKIAFRKGKVLYQCDKMGKEVKP